MARRSTSLANWEPHFLSILRIVSGLLLLQPHLGFLERAPLLLQLLVGNPKLFTLHL